MDNKEDPMFARLFAVMLFCLIGCQNTSENKPHQPDAELVSEPVVTTNEPVIEPAALGWTKTTSPGVDVTGAPTLCVGVGFEEENGSVETNDRPDPEESLARYEHAMSPSYAKLSRAEQDELRYALANDKNLTFEQRISGLLYKGEPKGWDNDSRHHGFYNVETRKENPSLLYSLDVQLSNDRPPIRMIYYVADAQKGHAELTLFMVTGFGLSPIDPDNQLPITMAPKIYDQPWDRFVALSAEVLRDKALYESIEREERERRRNERSN